MSKTTGKSETLVNRTGFLLGREEEASPRTLIGFERGSDTIPSAGLAGLPIWNDTDSHIGLFAPTGSGKGRNVLVPILLSTKSPVIVIDVKGELARMTARYRKNVLRQTVAIVDPWHCVTDTPDLFNPLDTIDPKSPTLVDDLYAMTGQFSGPVLARDPYWDGRSQCFNSGVLTHLVTGASPGDRTLGKLWDIAHGEDTEHDLAVLLDATPDMHPYARAEIAALLSLRANETRSCIISTVREHLRLFASASVREAVEATTLDLNAIAEGAAQTTYFVIPPDKLASHSGILKVWLSSLINLMIRRRHPPKASTLLLLDEVAQLGRMNELVQVVTLMRGYGVRCLLALQSYAQLKTLYPTEHEVLIENCGTIVTFGHTAMSMSQQMAAMLGDISAGELFGMNEDQLAIRLPHMPTRIATRNDYVLDKAFRGRFDVDERFRSPA